MNIVPRHVLCELLKVFLMALAGLTLLMLIVGVTRQALDEGVGLKHIKLSQRGAKCSFLSQWSILHLSCQILLL